MNNQTTTAVSRNSFSVAFSAVVIVWQAGPHQRHQLYEDGMRG